MTPPRVLTIAGSDSGGGAGIQADLKTMLALGVHGMSVVTAVTAQNSLGVQGYWELPEAAVRAQLDSVLTDIGVEAVKTGMLASTALIETVADRLRDIDVPIVVDPVACSKHGDSLLAGDAVIALRERLLPLATVVTPNLPEAELLTGVQVHCRDDLEVAAKAVRELGPQWVLVKGGHLAADDDATDLLYGGDRPQLLRSKRIHTVHTHGTGCTLASAIASYIALGNDVPDAVIAAKAYVTEAIKHGYPLGGGIGPVDHGWRR